MIPPCFSEAASGAYTAAGGGGAVAGDIGAFGDPPVVSVRRPLELGMTEALEPRVSP